MTIKDLKKLVVLASDQKGGWESYRAREKAQAELLHYLPRLIGVAETAASLLSEEDASKALSHYVCLQILADRIEELEAS